jgi:hypothetical protein
VASGVVRDAFKAALLAEFPGLFFDTLNASPPFIPDESAGAPPPIWYTLGWPGSTERRSSLGSPACRRESGQAEVWVIAESGKGDAAATAAADAVRAKLRDRQLTAQIRTGDAEPPIHFTPDDGDYFAAVVAVSYVYEFFQ